MSLLTHVCYCMTRPTRCPVPTLGSLVQAHRQLLCVTTLSNGTLTLGTAAGSATADYSSIALLVPPIVRGVEPPVWSSIVPTVVTITGERCCCP